MKEALGEKKKHPVKFWSDDNEQRFFLSDLRFIRGGLKHERLGQFLKAD